METARHSAESIRISRRVFAVPRDGKHAFIAAEDANFWTHGGVDYEGILRAIGRNVSKGRKAQGASMITMLVARNFLLTRAKTYERKICEVILSRRIEETFRRRF
jgi:penicillin-binding protein 1A